MKRILILLLFAGSFFFCSGQQKQKQIREMLEQIAANKMYMDHLKKGYSIVHDGLQTIRQIKKGNFDLQFNFFDSLKKVNPQIKNSEKAAEIIAIQFRIIKNTQQTIRDIEDMGQFTGEELKYCKVVFNNLFTECSTDIDELVLLITDGTFSMTDDERLQRIDRIYTDMQDKYSFSSSFNESMGVLSAQRSYEQSEIYLSRKINLAR